MAKKVGQHVWFDWKLAWRWEFNLNIPQSPHQCVNISSEDSFSALQYYFQTVYIDYQKECNQFYVFTLLQCINEPPHDKTNKIACTPSVYSDQPGHPPSLIRVFGVRMKKARVLSYPLSAQRRFWSDLSLRWAQGHFVGFVMRWHKYWWTGGAHTTLQATCQTTDRLCSAFRNSTQLFADNVRAVQLANTFGIRTRVFDDIGDGLAGYNIYTLAFSAAGIYESVSAVCLISL